MSLPRREFLQHSVLTAGACLLGAGSAVKETTVKGAAVNAAVPIVDTHQHLWDLKEFTLPWHGGDDVASLRRSFLPSDYADAIRGSNVVKSVYMEVDVLPAQQPKEADYVIDLCSKGETTMVAAVISGRPSGAEFKDYITKYAKSKYIKGVRQVLHGESTPAGYCLQPRFVEGIKLLGELGLSFDLCMRSGDLLDAVKLVDQCPNTRFIVDHCGNMSVQSKDEAARAIWMKGMKELAARPNTVCKISGIVASAKPLEWTAADLAPNVNYSMQTFGPDRIMFGGDWPVCTLAATYSQWVQALQTITRSLPEDQKRKLFHDNAVKFYGLK